MTRVARPRLGMKRGRLSFVQACEGEALGDGGQGVAAVRVLAPGLDLFAQDRDELVDVALHLLDLLLHVEDDLDSCQVDAEIPRQGQDDLEPLDRVGVVQPRVPLGADWAQQPLPLVEAERLRMDPEALGDRPDAENTLALAAVRRHRACPLDLAATIRSTPARSVALILPGSIEAGITNSRLKFP